MRVVAAVPVYNMSESLGALLPILVSEGFDEVVVLDDASSDGSADIAAAFEGVTIVRGTENIGCGANRNRILPLLRDEDVVLFLDADLEMRSTGIAAAVRGWFADPVVGAAGGLILTGTGTPMHWNYGSFMNPLQDARTKVYEELIRLAQPGSPAFLAIRHMALENHDTFNFEIQYAEPVRRVVDWVAGGLFAVRGGLFKKLGGFDVQFRVHEEQDLCTRIAAVGLEVRFEPDVVVHHLETDVRGEGRWAQFRESRFLYFRKHWGMSRSVHDRLFP
jgi:glycosyltransferase involved in cell wall biosynthesis